MQKHFNETDLELVDYCNNGDVEGVQRLFEEGNSFRNPIISEVFVDACMNGHLHIAQTLLQLNPTTLNCNTQKYSAFTYACMNKQLHVAEWLLELNPKLICWKGQELFLSACQNGDVEVAQWLQSKRPERFQMELEDGEIVKWSICFVRGDKTN